MAFSDRLQNMRRQKGISQESLAELLGVSRQSVSKWESGHSYPEVEKIIAISEYFDISIDILLKETSEDIMPQCEPPINLSKDKSQQYQPEPDSFAYDIPKYNPPVDNNFKIADSPKKIKFPRPRRHLNPKIKNAFKIIFGAVMVIIMLTGFYEWGWDNGYSSGFSNGTTIIRQSDVTQVAYDFAEENTEDEDDVYWVPMTSFYDSKEYYVNYDKAIYSDNMSYEDVQPSDYVLFVDRSSNLTYFVHKDDIRDYITDEEAVSESGAVYDETIADALNQEVFDAQEDVPEIDDVDIVDDIE